MTSFPEITRENFDAVLFDLDGVLTATAKLHAAAWKQMFDQFLKRRAEAQGRVFVPFDIGDDYLQYVDGKLSRVSRAQSAGRSADGPRHRRNGLRTRQPEK